MVNFMLGIFFHKKKKSKKRASLVAQWWRMHLPTKEMRVWPLVQEDPTCSRATKPVSHNYWACEQGKFQLKRIIQGLPWWSCGWDSTLPTQGGPSSTLVRELDPPCLWIWVNESKSEFALPLCSRFAVWPLPSVLASLCPTRGMGLSWPQHPYSVLLKGHKAISGQQPSSTSSHCSLLCLHFNNSPLKKIF